MLHLQSMTFRYPEQATDFLASLLPFFLLFEFEGIINWRVRLDERLSTARESGSAMSKIPLDKAFKDPFGLLWRSDAASLLKDILSLPPVLPDI